VIVTATVTEIAGARGGVAVAAVAVAIATATDGMGGL
jgi:hypothetical protein